MSQHKRPYVPFDLGERGFDPETDSNESYSESLVVTRETSETVEDCNYDCKELQDWDNEGGFPGQA